MYSELGEGTTFKIFLPITSDRLEKPGPEAEPIEVRSGAGRSVLVVEDEPGVRKLVGRILLGAGFDVLTADDAESALRIAERFEGKIDVVLTDVILPQMSGKQLSERLTSQRPDTKTLYMSGYTDDIVAERGTISEHESFIQKPFNSGGLLRKLTEVLTP